jgi:hypothetical protein
MRKFLRESFYLFVILTVLYFLVSFLVKSKDDVGNDYMAAMIDKHERISKLDKPKLILAGDSNLAFGIDSKKIEQELLVPVVNLSLHAGLGLDFILKELEASINEGDIVFLSFEYFIDHEGNYELKKHTSNYYKKALNYYNFDLKKDVLLHINTTHKNLKNSMNGKNVMEDQSGPVYTRAAFNKYGDAVAHLDKKHSNGLNGKGMFEYRYWEGIDYLNEFYEYARSKEVCVFFIYPNYPISEFKNNEDVINRYSNDLSNDLKIEIINKPTDFVYSDDLFYDTIYHLNRKGRELRTNKLIQLIKENLNLKKCLEEIYSDL